MGKPLGRKVALVTGGARGIGAAIVRRLAQEGSHVAFTYSSSGKAAKALVKEVCVHGVKAKAYLADAAAPKSLALLVAKVCRDFGGLDILVNNAGVFLGGRIGEIRAADYERLMRINGRSWAKDLGAKGILVNAVQPGPIHTDLNPETGENADVQKFRTALGRFGRPEEVAAAVVFLAGPDATYITGATLNVDGGWNA